MTNVAAPADAPSMKQPKGLYLLFNVEMWERFSFYGMRAILILFLVSNAGGFGWSKERAGKLYGLYTSSVYLTPILGGFLADRFLGIHRSILIGSLLIASGHFCLAFPSVSTFYVGLGLIMFGTGFHKSNISTMVGKLYGPEDRRRDAAYTIFYMGINTGAFLGQIICGSFAKSPTYGWHWGFGAAGVGMVLGTIVYILRKKKYLGTIGDKPAAPFHAAKKDQAPPITASGMRGIGAIVIMAFFNIFFWSAFEQAGSSMNLFAEEHTDRWILGWQMPAPWFQSVNALVIMICAPMFAALWTRLAARGREPSTPIKFVWALVLVALGFAVLATGARRADLGILVSPVWLILAYVLHTWGELCLSPVGLSMVSRLAPIKVGSLMMGLWFFSFSLSDLTGGLVASQIEKIEKGHLLFGGQTDFFLIFVAAPLVGAGLLWLLSGTVKRLMKAAEAPA